MAEAGAPTPRVLRSMFPKDFFFGTATAAYQVEGAAREGGRGMSIWDEFSHTPGKTKNGDTGDEACDHYHRIEEDIGLMADMGVDAYRLSLSWPRLLPSGRGPVNKEGVAFYNRLIDGLLAKGIQPYITLYHWDLPLALEKEFGGWLGDDIVPAFAEYAELCFVRFGDRVKHWITVNEPQCFSVCGYSLGIHAPGRSSDRSTCAQGNSATEPYLVAHNVLRAHAAAASLYHSKFKAQGGSIGLACDAEWAEAISDSPQDLAASQRRMEFQLAWLLDPVFFGDYPASMRAKLGPRLPRFSAQEREQLQGSLDFVGLNHYTSKWVRHDSTRDPQAEDPVGGPDMFWDNCMHLTAEKDGTPIGERAASEWLYIVPWGLKKVLLWITARYSAPPIIITENGMDDEDDPSLPLEKALSDSRRIQYYNDYLLSVAGAISEGANMKGYFAWSFMDNFEWREGYARRFGIHFVDYKNGRARHPKRSAKWWKEFLRGKAAS